MRPGELVRTLIDAEPRLLGIDDNEDWVEIPPGTPVLIFDVSEPDRNGEQQVQILVQGRKGWLWLNELEGLDETR